MTVAQHPGRNQVHSQADARDEHRFVEADGQGLEEASHRLPGDQNRDHRQDHGARVPTEHAHLPGSERVTGIAGVSARVEIGERGDAERRRVARHVPAVGEERHRVEGVPGDDLDDHHRRREGDDPPGLDLAARLAPREDSCGCAAISSGFTSCMRRYPRVAREPDPRLRDAHRRQDRLSRSRISILATPLCVSCLRPPVSRPLSCSPAASTVRYSPCA